MARFSAATPAYKETQCLTSPITFGRSSLTTLLLSGTSMQNHSRVVPNARLVEDLGADSLDLVDIVFSLEDHFGCEIAEEDVARVVTVGDVVELIQGRA